jgi:hypothetical protein
VLRYKQRVLRYKQRVLRYKQRVLRYKQRVLRYNANQYPLRVQQRRSNGLTKRNSADHKLTMTGSYEDLLKRCKEIISQVLD